MRRFLFAATLIVAIAGSNCGGPAAPAPGVVLVIVDTLRPDHLGAYGYSRDTSPNLDRLAAEGELYTEAWGQAPWTLPAVATLLTGQLPQVHGAGKGGDGRLYPLNEDVPTLAGMLQNAGFATGAVINVDFLRPDSGLSRGFEEYDVRFGAEERDAGETTDAALEWARQLGERPFLLLVHYFDPHLTYDPPAPLDTFFEADGESAIPEGWGTAAQAAAVRSGELLLSPAQRRSLLARYDGEIRFTDEQFGRLRAGLEEMGLWKRSLVIVTSDHGEEFWEHGGFEHGHSHHRELLHVPLIVRRPGRPPAVHHQRVRQLDVLPTVLEFARQEIPQGLPGRALGDPAAGFSVAAGSLWSGYLLSIRSDDGTLIWEPASGHRRFYAPEDVAEERNLVSAASGDPSPGTPISAEADAGAATQTADRLEGILRQLPQTMRGSSWELSDEQRRRLRSLGYILD